MGGENAVRWKDRTAFLCFLPPSVGEILRGIRDRRILFPSCGLHGNAYRERTDSRWGPYQKLSWPGSGKSSWTIALAKLDDKVCCLEAHNTSWKIRDERYCRSVSARVPRLRTTTSSLLQLERTPGHLSSLWWPVSCFLPGRRFSLANQRCVFLAATCRGTDRNGRREESSCVLPARQAKTRPCRLFRISGCRASFVLRDEPSERSGATSGDSRGSGAS